MKVLLCAPMALKSIPTKTHTSYFRAYEYLFNNAKNLPFEISAIGTYPCQTFPIDANRNEIIAYALKENFDITIWFDFDMTFPEDICIQLLKHNLDIVTGMYYVKSRPYYPVMFDCVDKKKNVFKHFRPIINFPLDELFYADMIGMGCVAIKTDVFRAMQKPYFKYQLHPKDTIDTQWRFKHDNGINDVSEDVWFCEQVKKAGYKIIVDPKIQCGHLTEMETNIDLFSGYLEGAKAQYIKEKGIEDFNDKWKNTCKAVLVKKD